MEGARAVGERGESPVGDYGARVRVLGAILARRSARNTDARCGAQPISQVRREPQRAQGSPQRRTGGREMGVTCARERDFLALFGARGGPQ